MRPIRFLLALVPGVLMAAPARADEPIAVELRPSAAVGTALVTVGDVATVTGGDAATRQRVARTDLAELRGREPGATIGRRTVEYRLLLAGFDVQMTGAERAVVTVSRRAVTAEEVTAAARTELLKYYPNLTDPAAVALAVPVVVKLPEVPLAERVVIAGKPHGAAGAPGRVQMDMTVSVGGELLLAFAVHFDVRSAGTLGGPRPPGGSVLGPPVGSGVVPAAGAAPIGTEVIIQPRQRVQIEIHTGGLKVSTAGEAQQAGRLGQTIFVQNVDSKKVLSARVSGPGTVEIDLGGAP
jgi:hypothetical protein